MWRLICALCVGALAGLGALWVGVGQPGQWVADTFTPSSRGYDIFIHDHYFIVRPAVLVSDLFAYAAAALVIMRIARSAGRDEDGAGA